MVSDLIPHQVPMCEVKGSVHPYGTRSFVWKEMRLSS